MSIENRVLALRKFRVDHFDSIRSAKKERKAEQALARLLEKLKNPTDWKQKKFIDELLISTGIK
jgi:hypothetical protein